MSLAHSLHIYAYIACTISISAVTDVSEEEPEKTLELAEVVTERGSLALKEKNFHEAINCFRLALEIRVAHLGELSVDCLNAYYEYGCCLLEKAQDDAVKQERQGSSSGQEDLEEDGEDCQDDDPVADADEGDSDLDMALRMLDIARAITEKSVLSCKTSSTSIDMFATEHDDIVATEHDDIVAYLSGLAEDIEKKLENVKQLANNPKQTGGGTSPAVGGRGVKRVSMNAATSGK